jgi:hypothetical protein
MSFFTILPFISSALSFIVAFFILKRYAEKRGAHHLFWGLGMVCYGIGGFSEAYYGAFGWNDLIYRLWYLFGAILVAAWLGQGTVYLLVRSRWAHVLMVVLVLGSLYGALRVFTVQLDPSLMTNSLHTGSELSGTAIVDRSVRLLTPFFNLYGTVALVGGALWSAWIFWRKRILLHRVVGNVLIAFGALLPAFGGSFSRFGIPHALYIFELLGVIFISLGYWRAISPMKSESGQPGSDRA